MGLREEIIEQPRVLHDWLQSRLGDVSVIADATRKRRIDYVFLAGRGTSDHAGVYAQYLFGSRNRLPVALAAPSLFTMYPQSPLLGNALVIGISQSGQSPDIVSVIAEGRRQGALTLAVTNNTSSPLAQASEMTIGIDAGQERAVAATKTYTGELLALAALSVALAGNGEEDLACLRTVPDAVQTALEQEDAAARLATEYRDLDQCLVLGRGYNYATAQEWALKLKELAYVFTDVYSPADFQHGPIAILEEGFPILAVVPGGAVFESELALLRRLKDEYKAQLIIISDNDEALNLSGSGLRLPSGLPEWLTPIPAIIPAQLFCYHLTLAKGYDPEHPRMLRKVTLTR